LGNIKSSKTEDIRRGWIHVVGLVKTGLMVVVAQAAANLGCLRTWRTWRTWRIWRTGDRTDRLTWADPEDHGFEEIDPGSANPATGPPQPACVLPAHPRACQQPRWRAQSAAPTQDETPARHPAWPYKHQRALTVDPRGSRWQRRTPAGGLHGPAARGFVTLRPSLS
jgi:hypothetical protein